MGHNLLGGTVRKMCEIAGLQGHYTNHSLCATAATRLFEAGTDEQLIMQRTGHSTTAGVRSYKSVGEKLRATTSDALNGSKRIIWRHQNSLSPKCLVWCYLRTYPIPCTSLTLKLYSAEFCSKIMALCWQVSKVKLMTCFWVYIAFKT